MEEETKPAFTPQELGSMLLGLYKFLTTLHYDPADLKVPPPEGWPGFTPEACAYFRNDYAIQVLRYLPYLRDTNEGFHYKSGVLDYTTFEYEHFESRHQDLDQEEWWSTEGIVDAGWMVPLVKGYESGGREYYLNVLDGEVFEMILKRVDPGPMPLEVWIVQMQEDYRDLRLVPGPGRVTLDCTDVPERRDEDGGRISEEQVRQQTEYWPTDLDIQYVRQVYRDYGWPYAFRKDEAFAYMSQLLSSLEEENRDRYWEPKDFQDRR